MPEQQRPAEITERERQDVAPDMLRGDVVEAGEDEGIGEEDRVIEEGLRGDEGEPQHRASAMCREQGAHDRAEAGMAATADAQLSLCRRERDIAKRHHSKRPQIWRLGTVENRPIDFDKHRRVVETRVHRSGS